MDEIVKFLKLKGIPVYNPGELEYERSVATANLLHRFSRPNCVVQPRDTSDVQIVVQQASSRKIPITIKNGGHSYAGSSTATEGISLDLGKMKNVDLNMKSNIVTIQGGAQWGHAYKAFINGRHDGYVINGGRCPTVGVSGFILGGGLSPFTRSFGMGCDTLKEATIVTADGNTVTVRDSDDRESDKGKLFWALCGAGGGNFGVLVELKLEIQRLRNKEGYVVAGRYTWSPKAENMDDFMETMNDFYTINWPDRTTIDSSWLCDLRQTKSDLAVRFLVYHNGDKDDFDEVIDERVEQEDLRKQLKRRSSREKSTRFLHETLVEQWSEEILKAFPSNRGYRIYTSFVFKNKRDRIEEVTSIIREEMKTFRKLFRGEQALLQVTWIHSGGRASKTNSSDTAFYWRSAVYHTYIMIDWNEKWLERDMRGFLKSFKKELRPFSMTGQAAFINFPDGALSPTTHERAYYGENRQELRRIKEKWDKDNFFNWGQGIRLPQPKKTAAKRKGKSAAAMAADGELSGEEPAVDEQNLTDMIAGKAWERFTPPPRTDIVADIRDLTGLGF